MLKEMADLRQRLPKGGIQDEKRLEAIKDELTAATKQVKRYKKRMQEQKMHASKKTLKDAYHKRDLAAAHRLVLELACSPIGPKKGSDMQ